MHLKFGDPVSIQKRDEARREAETLRLFPDSKIRELIDELEDHFDASERMSFRQQERTIKFIRGWIAKCLNDAKGKQ